MSHKVIAPLSLQIRWPYELMLALSFGGVLGIALLWLPPLWVVGLLTVGFIIVPVLKRPELAVAGILFMSSTILAESQMPVVHVGPGRLYLTDIALLALFALIGMRLCVKLDFHLARTPLDGMMITFLALSLLSTVWALHARTLELKWAISELRSIAYYSLFFVVTNLVRTREQLVRLLHGIILLALLVALVTVIQYMFGNTLKLLPGRVEQLRTEGTSYNDITRILIPGQSTAFVVFIFALTSEILNGFTRFQGANLLLTGISGMAVLLTFNRSFWGATLLNMVLLFLILRRENRFRLMTWGPLILSIFVLVVTAIALIPGSRGGKLIQASLQRLGSLGQSNTFAATKTSTLRWRDFEYNYSIPQALTHPILGLGFGAQYRPRIKGIDHDSDGTVWWDGSRYTHNGHLWISMKGGLLAYLALLYMLGTAIVRGLRSWRAVPMQALQNLVLSFSLVYFALPAINIVNPTFVQWTWVPLIATMLGMSEAALRLAPSAYLNK